MSELIPHQAAIDPKYHYLLDAPRQDADGNPAIIRYSRKTRTQYVMSESEGKATGWSATFQEGRWEEKVTKKRKKILIWPRHKQDLHRDPWRSFYFEKDYV